LSIKTVILNGTFELSSPFPNMIENLFCFRNRHIHIFGGLLFTLILLTNCSRQQEPDSLSAEIQQGDILTHLSYLADDELKGREAGSPQEAEAANYIADHFRDFGLEPAGSNQTFFQDFTINTAVLNNPHTTDADTSGGEKRMAKNVVALLRGMSDSRELIIIGAHYDHLGFGEFGSLYSGKEPRIHNGADDNASGTAGLLELAHYFSVYRPATDLLFIAFSGEEMGLLGSQHFVENPTVELENVLAMINMDMIGRMNEKKLLIFGTGTSGTWPDILQTANTDSLNLELVKDGTGSSDHTSFYYQDIPVLHYFTDTHADYHRPSDDTEWINAEGTSLSLWHLVRVVEYLDTIDKENLPFTEAPGEQRRNITMDGPTLGVLPDYGFEGTGMRITGVTEGRAADRAGLKAGDVIVKLAGRELKDIYGYMEALNSLEKGQTTTITILRDGETMELELTL